MGSRKPSNHGRQMAYDFAYYLSEQGFYINSGLAQGIDEALKSRDQMAWVGAMNAIKAQAEEMALREFVYC